MKAIRQKVNATKEEFNDSHDVEKHVLDVHSSQLMEVLSGDLVMAVLDEKQRRFISNNIQSAHEALHMIKDKEMAEYCAARLLLKAFTEAILNRNVQNNPLIKLLLEQGRQDILQGQEPNYDQKIIETFEKDKRGK